MSPDPDYGPGWRPYRAPAVSYEDAIAAEHATHGHATEPDFAELARSTPWAADEWRSAWEITTKGFPSEDVQAAWNTIKELTVKTWTRPTSAARSLAAAVNATEGGGDGTRRS